MSKNKMKNQLEKNDEVIIYKTSKNEVELRVQFRNETVWLDTRQMALLFGTQRPAVVKHIHNIYKTKELAPESTCSILEQVAQDGKVRKINLYNLDAIISVGYRVNSQRATQFRIWATKTLRNHLIQGYTLNEKRLTEAREKFQDLQRTISFLREKSKKELLIGQEREILNLLSAYSKTLSLLEEYDGGKIKNTRGKKTNFILTYDNCLLIIKELKINLLSKKEAGQLFGEERDGSFAGIIRGLNQTFGKKELYPSIEDKAAHLLYLVIKDHPFSDGNKRMASFLFVYFLDKNNYLFRKTGERKINDNALVALALLIAESDPKEKEVMIRIIKNLIG